MGLKQEAVVRTNVSCVAHRELPGAGSAARKRDYLFSEWRQTDSDPSRIPYITPHDALCPADVDFLNPCRMQHVGDQSGRPHEPPRVEPERSAAPSVPAPLRDHVPRR